MGLKNGYGRSGVQAGQSETYKGGALAPEVSYEKPANRFMRPVLVFQFRTDGVQPHAVHLLAMRVQHQLPALVGLITVEAPLGCPPPRRPRDLLHTFNAGD